MKRNSFKLTLTLSLFLLFASTFALAEEVKVLLDVPAPYANEVYWFPDGRHLLLGSCNDEFEVPNDVPYSSCRFVVFDPKTQKQTPVKLAHEPGNWQAPDLLHLGMDGGSNCVWGISPKGKLYLRALPPGYTVGEPAFGPRASWIIAEDYRGGTGAHLFRYDPAADAYVDQGSYDNVADPLGAQKPIAGDWDFRSTRGAATGTLLYPFAFPYSPDKNYGFLYLDDVYSEGFEPGHATGPIYVEAALIKLSSKEILYKIAGDRVLVRYAWNPTPQGLQIALVTAPRDPKKVADPHYRRLLVLTIASQAPTQTKEGKKISFDQSDRTPKSCPYLNGYARPGTELPDNSWRTGPIDFDPAPGFDLSTCPEEER